MTNKNPLHHQARQLSNTSLAIKFERSLKTIKKIASGVPVRVPEDEQSLIRACIAERDRLKSQMAVLNREVGEVA